MTDFVALNPGRGVAPLVPFDSLVAEPPETFRSGLPEFTRVFPIGFFFRVVCVPFGLGVRLGVEAGGASMSRAGAPLASSSLPSPSSAASRAAAPAYFHIPPAVTSSIRSSPGSKAVNCSGCASLYRAACVASMVSAGSWYRIGGGRHASSSLNAAK